MQLTRFTYDGDDYRARYFIDGKRVSFDAYNMIFRSTRYRLSCFITKRTPTGFVHYISAEKES
jgi:hypothetical protein